MRVYDVPIFSTELSSGVYVCRPTGDGIGLARSMFVLR